MATIGKSLFIFRGVMIMQKELVILGAGGFGREASLLVEEINHDNKKVIWNLLGYIDQDPGKWGLKLRGYPVLGGYEALEGLADHVEMICVVAETKQKRKFVERAQMRGNKFATLIHPEISLADDVIIGIGTLINTGSILTTNIRIGEHVSINPGCGIGHDSVIGDYSTLMWRVNISGNVTIGEGCLVGTGATILPGIKVGGWTTVGAGSVVTRDLPEGCTALGIPARIRQ
jgi:sugar O-acyltransferase (sialic acid O-acetyltransferase NeuD family)